MSNNQPVAPMGRNRIGMENSNDPIEALLFKTRVAIAKAKGWAE